MPLNSTRPAKWGLRTKPHTLFPTTIAQIVRKMELGVHDPKKRESGPLGPHFLCLNALRIHIRALLATSVASENGNNDQTF